MNERQRKEIDGKKRENASKKYQLFKIGNFDWDHKQKMWNKEHNVIIVDKGLQKMKETSKKKKQNLQK